MSEVVQWPERTLQSRKLSTGGHGQWPERLLGSEHKDFLEGPFPQLRFQGGFMLFQKSLEQPSQWSFSGQMIGRHAWIDCYRREQWYVKSPVR